VIAVAVMPDDPVSAVVTMLMPASNSLVEVEVGKHAVECQAIGCGGDDVLDGPRRRAPDAVDADDLAGVAPHLLRGVAVHANEFEGGTLPNPPVPSGWCRLQPKISAACAVYRGYGSSLSSHCRVMRSGACGWVTVCAGRAEVVIAERDAIVEWGRPATTGSRSWRRTPSLRRCRRPHWPESRAASTDRSPGEGLLGRVAAPRWRKSIDSKNPSPWTRWNSYYSLDQAIEGDIDVKSVALA
jgi:hypothetical protein